MVTTIPSDLLLISDDLPAVAHEGGVEVEDDVDEEDDVNDGVDDDHDHRIVVDGPGVIKNVHMYSYVLCTVKQYYCRKLNCFTAGASSDI